MSLEIQHRNSRYQYRTNQDDPRLIDRRLNKSGARWQVGWRMCASAEAAQAALLRARGERDENHEPTERS